MNRQLITFAFIAGLAAIAAGSAVAESGPIATKPPLGWNSFDSFDSFDSYGVYLHEKAAMENLDAMAKHLMPYGYEYFVVDKGWFGEYKLKPGTLYPLEKHAGDVRINEFGHVIGSQSYFPGGLAPITKRCHELGLKFGIHRMRGIPRKVCGMNLPIKGTTYKARDISDTKPKNNCIWCTYKYGVDMSKPGAQEWYDGLIRHLADNGGVEVWKTPEMGGDREGWAGVFNLTDRVETFSLTPASIGLDADATAYNIWKGRKAYQASGTSPIEIDINPDGVIFLRYE